MGIICNIANWIPGWFDRELIICQPDQPKPVTPAQQPQVKAATASAAADAADKRSPCTKTIADCAANEACDDYIEYLQSVGELKVVVEDKKPAECDPPKDIENLLNCSGTFIRYHDAYERIVGVMGGRMMVIGRLFASPDCIDDALALDKDVCCYYKQKQSGQFVATQQAASTLAEQSRPANELAVAIKKLETKAKTLEDKVGAYDMAKKGVAAWQKKVARAAEQVRGADSLYKKYGESEDETDLEAKQKILNEAQETLKTFQNNDLVTAKDELQAAVEDYNDAKRTFMAAARAGKFRVSGRDAKLAKWDDILQQAKNALGVTSAPVEKEEGDVEKPEEIQRSRLF